MFWHITFLQTFVNFVHLLSYNALGWRFVLITQEIYYQYVYFFFHNQVVDQQCCLNKYLLKPFTKLSELRFYCFIFQNLKYKLDFIVSLGKTSVFRFIYQLFGLFFHKVLFAAVKSIQILVIFNICWNDITNI